MLYDSREGGDGKKGSDSTPPRRRGKYGLRQNTKISREKRETSYGRAYNTRTRSENTGLTLKAAKTEVYAHCATKPKT